MEKTVFILVGLKGSGKTYIGSLIENHTDVKFIRVESIWLGLRQGDDGWSAVEAEVKAQLKKHPRVMIESLGGTPGFSRLTSSLQSVGKIRFIHVICSMDKCFHRVKTRSSSDHIPVSDDKVKKYNQIAETVVLDWALEIDNNGPARPEVILEAFFSL